MKRRTLLAGAVGFSSLALYVNHRGLRYPRLTFEPKKHATELERADAIFTWNDVIAINSEHTKQQDTQSNVVHFRAIAPEPSLSIKTLASTQLSLSIDNISPEATLNIVGKDIKKVDEQIQGLNRQLVLESSGAQTIELNWTLDWQDGFDFAILGDTGGDSELDWSLKRAHELGAKFLLHLGDFNYIEGEYDLAITAFANAAIPTYVSIGNHDFNDDGLIYKQFLNEIGPMNHAFVIGGVRFINLDTALNFFPAGSGNRSDFFQALLTDETPYSDQVIFTHRPLKDPRPNDDHHITGINEIEWVGKMCRAVGAKNYFNGHVHHSSELDIEGLHQYTAGEGLGHEDIILQRQVAQLLMGRVQLNKPVSYRWASLNMPWALHTSPTHESKLRRVNRLKQLEWLQKMTT